MKDGLVVFYSKDDTLYPVLMNEYNLEALEMMSHVIFPNGIKVASEFPMGKALDLTEDVKAKLKVIK